MGEEEETGSPDAMADSWLPGDRHDVEATDVESPGIATVLYARKGGVLQVRFRNGCAYCYRGVQRSTYDGLMKSKSKEKYLQRRIRKSHTRIEIDRPGIREVHIQNFRSIHDKKVRLGDLTVLIGANGTGKTSVLDALEIFLSKEPGGTGVTDEDYYPKSTRIDITLTVNPGSHAVREEFLRNGAIRLQKSFTKDGAENGKAIRVETRRNRDFGTGRDKMSADELKKLAAQICKKYPGAPAYTKKPEYLEAITKYELMLSHDPKHADKYCSEFVAYRAKQGDGGLEAVLSSLIFAPAARDIATDGEEGSGSLLSYLLNRTVRAELGDTALDAVSKKRAEAHNDYKRIVSGSLRRLGKRLGKRARRYMGNARFKIELDDPESLASHPGAHVRLRDNGHMSLVENAGSGFQRVYLLSLLDLVAGMGGRGAGGATSTTQLIVIDEPELYQHPQRQRQILGSLIAIAEGDPFVRIVCSTHSPYFVELRRVDTLRLFRKGREKRPRSVTLERLMAPMLGRDKSESPGGREELTTWLDMNATHWITEGFFARMVAMVEGPGDRNMLLGTARAVGVDLSRHEISIAPADGVESVPKFTQMFLEFGIPVYQIWDLDHRHFGHKEDVQERNKRMVSLACGIRQWSAPYGTIINSQFACFEDTLTTSLAKDLHACEDLLGGNAEHKGLKRAQKKDMDATRRNRERAEREIHESAAEDPDKGDVIDSQKKFLNSKLSVYNMLMAVKEKSPETLEKFEIVRVVRMLDALGREAKARAGGKARA